MLKKLSLFYTNNKTVIFGSIAAIVCILWVSFYIKDTRNQKIIAANNAQIESLTATINALSIEKTNIQKDVEIAKIAFSEQKKKADLLEQKLNNLPPVHIPTTTSTGSAIAPECVELLTNMKAEYDLREVEYQQVILAKNDALNAANIIIQKQDLEIATDNKIIAADNERNKIHVSTETNLTKQLESETHRKILYRNTSGVLLVVVIILSL